MRSYSYAIAAPKDARHVALVINLSAAIDPELIRAAMQAHADFATAIFTTPEPKCSLIRNPKDLRAFHERMRECLNTIEGTFGSECIVHVFPAMPASTAVQFGRLLLPKASPSLQIYDHHGDRAGFAPTLWLVRRTPRPPTKKSTALARTA